MNIYTRKLKASSEYFSGFEIDIDIRYYDSMNEICEHFKNELLLILKKYNFEVLYEKCSTMDFHNHTHQFEEILLLDCSDIIYICDQFHL